MRAFTSSPALRFSILPVAMFAIALAGCEDKKKVSEQGAVEEVARLAPVVKEDAEQVRKGLPQGAAKLGTLVDADTLANPVALQRAIATARASVQDLDRAKSTFFSFADPSGTVLRSESDPDFLAGKSVLASFPTLKKALDPASGNVEAYGEMPEMRGVKNGPDLAWVVAHPVKDDKGLKGLFVTGWSFRRFSYHLEETAKRHLIEATEKAGKKNAPVVYVFMVKGNKAYGAPLAPDVNAQSIESLNVLEKTQAGPFHTAIEITGRVFGVAAQRTPELGDDAAVVVLLSEF